MLITLVVCTYNRLDILKVTMPSYLSLRVPDDVTLDVVIIDNNSQDGTRGFVEDFIRKKKNTINIKYILEPKQGVSFARNTGYKNASGDYIGYLDDECVLPEQWLEVAVENILAEQPAFLGGPYFGKFLPKTTSSWCKESFGDSYMVEHNLPNAPLEGRYLSEGNMLVRKDIFQKVGLFDTELGMTGEKISYGEGPDFQQRFLTEYPNEVIWYNPKLFVWHLIRDEKISIVYRFKEALIRGASAAELAKGVSRELLLLSPLLLIYYVFYASLSATRYLVISIFSREHFYTLLHNDYQKKTWRDIGRAWYRSKLLFKSFFRSKL